MDYGKREVGGAARILSSHNPLISDLGYFVTKDLFKSFLVCKDLFNCKDLFLILTASARSSTSYATVARSSATVSPYRRNCPPVGNSGPGTLFDRKNFCFSPSDIALVLYWG